MTPKWYRKSGNAVRKNWRLFAMSRLETAAANMMKSAFMFADSIFRGNEMLIHQMSIILGN